MIASASAKGAENAIMGKITPFTFADPINIAGKSASVKLRRMKPIVMVTTTAVAPASVGVRRPEKIPKKMIPGTINAYQPDPKDLPKFKK